jgi:hypothetical protein
MADLLVLKPATYYNLLHNCSRNCGKDTAVFLCVYFYFNIKIVYGVYDASFICIVPESDCRRMHNSLQCAESHSCMTSLTLII